MHRRLLGGLVALLTVPLLAGCSAGGSSGLARSVAQSQSAVQTARLALVQLRDGRVVDGVASTALTDMLTEAQTAEASAAATPATAAERSLRDRTLALLHAASTAVLAGQDAEEHAPGAPSTTAAIHRLGAVLTRLQAEQRRLGSGR